MEKLSKIDSPAEFLQIYSDGSKESTRIVEAVNELYGYYQSRPELSQMESDEIMAELAKKYETMKKEGKGHSSGAKNSFEVREELTVKAAEYKTLAVEMFGLQDIDHAESKKKTAGDDASTSSREKLRPSDVEGLKSKEVFEQGLVTRSTRKDDSLPLDQGHRSKPSSSQTEPTEPEDCAEHEGCYEEEFLVKFLETSGIPVEYCDCPAHSREEQAKVKVASMMKEKIKSEKALKGKILTLEKEREADAEVRRDLKKSAADISTRSINSDARIQELESQCESQKRTISDLKIEHLSLEVDNKQLREKIEHLEERKDGQAGKIKSLEAELESNKQTLQHTKHSLQCASSGGAFETVVGRGQQRTSMQNLHTIIQTMDATIQSKDATIKNKDAQLALYAGSQESIRELQEQQYLQHPFYEGGKKIRASYLMARQSDQDARNERNNFAHGGNIILDLALVNSGHFEGEDASQFLTMSYGEGVRDWVPTKARYGSDSVPAALLQLQKIVDILNGRSSMHHQGSFGFRSPCHQTDSEFEALDVTFWKLISGIKRVEHLKTETFLFSIYHLHNRMKPLWEKITMLAAIKRGARNISGVPDAAVHDSPEVATPQRHALGEYVTSDNSAKTKKSRKNKKKETAAEQ